MPTKTERMPQEAAPQIVQEHLHPGQTGVIDFDSRIGDYYGSLRGKGIEGELVGAVEIGRQSFMIIRPTEEPSQPGYYRPFYSGARIGPQSPIVFELDPRSPFILVHDGDSGLTGRALRPGHPISLGREAGTQDSKSERFDYKHDSYLSRHHAAIEVDTASGVINIFDTSSSNGTDIIYGRPESEPDESRYIKFPLVGKVLDAMDREQRESARENRHGEKASEASKALMLLQEFFPQQQVDVEGKSFLLTRVFDEGDRSYAIMYTTIDKGGHKIDVPRLLYKSLSDGGWRAAYGISESGRLIKEAMGEDSHYTQETKLRPEIVDALEQAEVVRGGDRSLINKAKSIFLRNSAYVAEIDTRDEISNFKSRYDRVLQPIRKLSAGQTEAQDLETVQRAGFDSIGAYLQSLDSVFEDLPGFMPDYSQPPIQTTKREHSLLGETIIDDYPARLGDTELIWSMARDRSGRVWIENIRVKSAPVSTYGTSSIVFNGGILTCKPLEYQSQTGGLDRNERNDFDRQYDDITPLLENLLPIWEYRKARELWR